MKDYDEDQHLVDSKAGSMIRIEGELITVRDQSLKRLLAVHSAGGKLPLDLRNKIIFFAGPTPGFDSGHGSIGPTTSWRMASYIPFLIEMGVRAVIGKGGFPEDTAETIRESSMLYLQALGGAGAYYGSRVKSIETVLYPELGPEAIFRLEVKDFPLIISIDNHGKIYP